MRPGQGPPKADIIHCELVELGPLQKDLCSKWAVKSPSILDLERNRNTEVKANPKARGKVSNPETFPDGPEPVSTPYAHPAHWLFWGQMTWVLRPTPGTQQHSVSDISYHTDSACSSLVSNHWHIYIYIFLLCIGYWDCLQLTVLSTTLIMVPCTEGTLNKRLDEWIN